MHLSRLFLLVLCCVVLSVSGQTGGAPMLVSAEWLGGQLKTPGLVILHAGTAKDYEAGHIPGARLLELTSISTTTASGLRLELPEESVLLRALEGAGVSNSSRVIIYASATPQLPATRVWFTFDALGLSGNASVLNGGLAAWRAAGQAVSTEAAPAPAAGSITAKIHPERLAQVDWIREHLSDANTVILDARLPQFHSGADAGIMPRAGRIPGSRNVPFNTLFDKDGKMLSDEELRALLGVQQGGAGKTFVSYCHLGFQATAVYFAARRLGLDVKLYDGSFQEWSGMANLPVETSPAGK